MIAASRAAQKSPTSAISDPRSASGQASAEANQRARIPEDYEGATTGGNATYFEILGTDQPVAGVLADTRWQHLIAMIETAPEGEVFNVRFSTSVSVAP